MSESAIHLDQVSKRYGRIRALDGVSARVEPGEVVGLLGPNGAGKSTLLRILVGLARPSSGAVNVLGRGMPRHRGWVLRRVGAMIEGPAFYPHLSGRQNLCMLRAYYGDVKPDRVDEALDVVGLTARARDPVGAYSVGMRRRLGLAAALLPSPAVLLLDEPTAGLDPEALLSVEQVLRREAHGNGVAVLLSSHLLGEVARSCDRVLVLSGGRLVGEEHLASRASEWTVLGASDPDRALAIAAALPCVRDAAREGDRILLHAPGLERADLVDGLVRAGVRVNLIGPHFASVEDYYFGLMRGSRGEPDGGGLPE